MKFGLGKYLLNIVGEARIFLLMCPRISFLCRFCVRMAGWPSERVSECVCVCVWVSPSCVRSFVSFRCVWAELCLCVSVCVRERDTETAQPSECVRANCLLLAERERESRVQHATAVCFYVAARSSCCVVVVVVVVAFAAVVLRTTTATTTTDETDESKERTGETSQSNGGRDFLFSPHSIQWPLEPPRPPSAELRAWSLERQQHNAISALPTVRLGRATNATNTTTTTPPRPTTTTTTGAGSQAGGWLALAPLRRAT